MESGNKKILIVEDDAFVQDIYRTKLSQEGFSIMDAENGEKALKKLESESPDLILLDIIMPLMNGLEFLEKLRADKKYKKTPVILLTNLGQKEDVEKGLALGANDYLIKSHFTPSEVLEKVKSYFK